MLERKIWKQKYVREIIVALHSNSTLSTSPAVMNLTRATPGGVMSKQKQKQLFLNYFNQRKKKKKTYNAARTEVGTGTAHAWCTAVATAQRRHILRLQLTTITVISRLQLLLLAAYYCSSPVFLMGSPFWRYPNAPYFPPPCLHSSNPPFCPRYFLSRIEKRFIYRSSRIICTDRTNVCNAMRSAEEEYNHVIFW